ncbi:MAG: phosphate ABC transporter permease PstA [Acidimicrobiales bacterium]|mgnify:FL=1|nr:phosphate ABC transporter permease PstA [Acidimicrobiales bacterium]
MALVDTDLTRDLVQARIQGRQSDTAGAVFKGLLVACLVVVLAALVALLISVAPAGLEVFSVRGVSDFVLRPFSVRPEKAGVFQGIVGTVTCALLVAVVAFPMGVAAAVYLEEYAHDNWFTRIVNLVIRNLAGVPAIVYGLLGFALFVDGPFTGFTGGTTLLSTGLTLSILVLPIVVITSAEAIRAVPSALREGGYGVGATRWEVTRTLVLPNAMGGMLTGTILGLARALGEAAPLFFMGAKTSIFSGGEWGDLRGDFTALPMIISDWATRPATKWNGNTQAAILVTLVLVLGINTVGIVLRNHFDKKR